MSQPYTIDISPCPRCGARDWHPKPFSNGKVWWCVTCALKHVELVIFEPRVILRNSPLGEPTPDQPDATQPTLFGDQPPGPYDGMV